MAPQKKSTAAIGKSGKRYLAGATVPEDEFDSEDFGGEDESWGWIYEACAETETQSDNEDDGSEDDSTQSRSGRQIRKKTRSQERKIIGARHGGFRCKIGDCVALKQEGNESWAGIIRNFSMDKDIDHLKNEMGAEIMCKCSPDLNFRHWHKILINFRVPIGNGYSQQIEEEI
jgi:hypothetical protein